MDKYEEALERAKEIYNAPVATIVTRTFLEQIFPELKESEDERIRKCLVDMVKRETGFTGFPSQGQVLAYLEKQKEQKPLMSDGEIEDKKRDIVAAIRKYYPVDYAEYLTSFLKGLSPEDNSEDEYGQEMLGIAYRLMYEHIPENLRTQEFWDSLKFMREYTGKVAIIHPYEHPAEWSKEDETCLEYALWCVTKTRLFAAKDVCDLDACRCAERWLKALRDRFALSHWKPSEEQMKALKLAYEDAFECPEGCVPHLPLKSLYEQLKKL